MALRVGLIGTGPWARRTHAPSLAAHPGIDFVGGWARNPQAAAEVFPQVFESPEALFAAVEAVAFAVPPNVQPELAAAAARAGKHLILDKPIAIDLDAAVALAQEVAAAEVRSVVTFTRRFAPETRDFLARAHEIGPTAAHGSWLSGAALAGPHATSPWRHEYGALYDVGPHVLDLLDAVLGPIVGVPVARYDEPSDTWTALLDHDGGATSSLTLALRIPIEPAELRIAVHSRAGVVALDRNSGRDTPAPDCFGQLLDEFLTAVETGVDHPLSVHRGVQIQRTIATIRDAADRH